MHDSNAHLTLVNNFMWGLRCSIDPKGLQADVSNEDLTIL